MAVMSVSTTIRNRRGSTMSASAPAGNVNRNIGRLLATCTIDTARGAALRFVINHAEAVSDIAMPVKANVLATHITAKAGWPNAPKRERRLSVESTAATEVELTIFPFVLVATTPPKYDVSRTSFSSLGARGLVFVCDVGLQTANSKSPGSSNPSRASDRF